MGRLSDRELKFKREPTTVNLHRTGSRGSLQAKEFRGCHPSVLDRFPQAFPTLLMLPCRLWSGDSGVREVAVRAHTSPPKVAEGSPMRCPASARPMSQVRPRNVPGPPRPDTAVVHRVIRETGHSSEPPRLPT